MYDFWGFGDLDIVWGNMEVFYTNELLDKFDVFSTMNDRISGHLTIIRNNEKYRKFCFQIPDWENKLTDDKHYALDESDFSNIVFPALKNIRKFYGNIIMRIFDWKTAWEIYYTVFPFIHIILKTKNRKLYFKEQHTTPIWNPDGRLYKYESDCWFYKDGKITNSKHKKEYMYLHFLFMKKNSFKENYYWKDDFYSIPENYNFEDGLTINKHGIFPFVDTP